MWGWWRSCWAAEAEKRKSRKCGVDKHAFMRYNQPCVCGRSSSGRARPCQGRGSEFEPRRPLQKEAPSLRMVLLFACSAALTVVSAGCRPLARCGSRDTSSKPPRFIRRRRRFGAFLVARGQVIESARETRLRFPLHTPPFLAVCRGADSRYSCHAAFAAWQLSFPGVLSPAGRALSAKPSAPETRSPGASAGSAASTALQDGPHSPYPVRTSARTCW